MTRQTEFWKLDQLSHSQLLESLHGVLRTKRRALAELIAHLGEVEERRLHLEAAHGSMFDYCVVRLGMSEDEACRRIDLARLARKYPALYPLLASGEIALSVALVLKPILSQVDPEELFAAARGKSIREARELVAQHAPRPDVPFSIRKHPERRAAVERATEPQAPLPKLAPALAAPLVKAAPAPASSQRGCVDEALVETPRPALAPPSASDPARAAPPRHPSRLEPLSPQRYKVQFTIDKTVKDQLEQARDLLRHAIPDGDFGAIFGRALELLIADLLKHRFGVGARRKAQSPRSMDSPAPVPPGTSAPVTAEFTGSHVPSAARRTVLERDGLACTWRDAKGKRCGCRAWLEIDHCRPRAKGGGSEPENLRILCRAHNQLAAEHEYGRAHIRQATRFRQRGASSTEQTSAEPTLTPTPT
jgi:hypothetical protein